MKARIQKPTGAFVAAAWIALLAGMASFVFGLWNSNLQLNEKGFFSDCADVWVVCRRFIAKVCTR
jgi:uncharacterized membrane protein YiaA